MSQPGPALGRHTADVVFVVDVSGSMAADGKIQALNTAVEEALPHLRRSAVQSPGVSLRVRVLTFATQAQWVVATPQLIEDFSWPVLEAKPHGLTELGLALHELGNALVESDADLPPGIVLISDGMPTDTEPPSFADALRRLDALEEAQDASRAAVAVGRDLDLEPLRAFLAPMGTEPVMADTPQQLVAQIQLVGSTVLRSGGEDIW